MTSRLDPLPNVGIDALFYKTPMHCFENACGIGNLLKEDDLLASNLVAPYLDVSRMADQVTTLIENDEKRDKVREQGYLMAGKWFNMKDYIVNLTSQAEKIIEDERILNENLDYLNTRDLLNTEWCSTSKKTNKRDISLEYLLRWKSNIWSRKPFPGFNPAIYREMCMNSDHKGDPFVHYLESGKPQGKWNAKMIVPSGKKHTIYSSKTAIHIHVYYTELLSELLDSIILNRNKPDIYITYSEIDSRETIESITSRYNINIKEITKIPNTGRNIGPLVSYAGRKLDDSYDIYGHFHTKKSAFISDTEGKKWRNFLISNLLGNKKYCMIDTIIDEFDKDKKLGLVFPDDPTYVGWQSNLKEAKRLAPRLNIKEMPESLDFPVGAMFWARKGALTSLYNLNLEWKDYPKEPIGYDGTVLHAIERLIPLVVEQSGYRYALTHIKGTSR